MRWLVVTLALVSFVSVAQADIDFEGAIGPVNGVVFTDPLTGVEATFNWSAPLEIADLSPFGVAPFGMGSLSTFADPANADFITMNLTAPAGFLIVGFSFDMGDFGEDLDELRVTTLSPAEPLADVANTTDHLLDMPTTLLPFGFTYQTFFFGRALGIGDFEFPPMTINPAVSMRAGSPAFPNSVFFDNFHFEVIETGDFQIGTDDPESGFGGGGGGGMTLTGPGGLPQNQNGTIPEPSALALLAVGVAALALRRRRR